MNRRDYSHDFATFVKVAILAGIALVVIREDLQDEAEYTKNIRAGLYAIHADGPTKGE